MKSRFLLRKLCTVLMAAILASRLIAPGHAAIRSAGAPTGETPDITPVIEKYHAHIQTAMHQEHVPGLAIAVVDDHNVLWLEGFGYTGADRRIPVTVDTAFSIQSMSKSFTAVTVLLAVQDGLLDLDTPLSSYLPGFRVNSIFEADAADKINLRNLLSHTAGFTHEAPVGNNYVLAPSTFETHIASIQDTWLKFPVGQRYAYSNLGIDLAAYILQVRAGKPFAQYAHEKIFAPLGMAHSTFDIDVIATLPDRAMGHDILVAEPPLVAMMASGGVYTTAADMARYLQFHLNGGVVQGQQLISEELLQTMYTPQFPASVAEDYGLGIGVFRNHNARMLAHGGGGFGFLSNMIWYPELKLGIVTLTNSSSHNLVFTLEQQILDDIIALDPVMYAQRASITPPAAVRNEQRAGVLSDSALRARIQTLAPTPSAAQRAEWRQYTGIYGVRTLNNITQIMVLEMPGDYLTLDGEQIYGFGSGLFFLSNGEALNLAADPPTYRNIPLQKLNPIYYWFLRSLSGVSLVFFLGTVLALPVIGGMAFFRRKRRGSRNHRPTPRLADRLAGVAGGAAGHPLTARHRAAGCHVPGRHLARARDNLVPVPGAGLRPPARVQAHHALVCAGVCVAAVCHLRPGCRRRGGHLAGAAGATLVSGGARPADGGDRAAARHGGVDLVTPSSTINVYLLNCSANASPNALWTTRDNSK